LNLPAKTKKGIEIFEKEINKFNLYLAGPFGSSAGEK